MLKLNLLNETPPTDYKYYGTIDADENGESNEFLVLNEQTGQCRIIKKVKRIMKPEKADEFDLVRNLEINFMGLMHYHDLFGSFHFGFTKMMQMFSQNPKEEKKTKEPTYEEFRDLFIEQSKAKLLRYYGHPEEAPMPNYREPGILTDITGWNGE